MPLKVFTSLAFAMILVAIVGHAPEAKAISCSYSIGSPNFGALSPLDNQQVLTQTTFTATCSGTANQDVKVCLHLGNGTTSPRQMTSNSNLLNYEIYQDAARTQRWGSGVSPASGEPTPLFLHLPETAGVEVSKTQTLYLKLFSGQQNAVPGAYLSNFAGSQTAVAVVAAATGTCSTYQTVQRVPFIVSATVAPECEVTAGPMNFGSRGVLAAAADASANINVRCTSTTPYAISVGNGRNGSSPTSRKMALRQNSIAYGLFSDAARRTVLGSAPGQTIGGSGSGVWTALPIYGRVPPQATPPAGAYADVVVISITY